MRLDFGDNKIDVPNGNIEKIELLGMRGRKQILHNEIWDEFKTHLKDLRGVPTYWSYDEANKCARVWPVPNMAMHVEVTMYPIEEVSVAEPEILTPLPKVRKVREQRA